MGRVEILELLLLKLAGPCSSCSRSASGGLKRQPSACFSFWWAQRNGPEGRRQGSNAKRSASGAAGRGPGGFGGSWP